MMKDWINIGRIDIRKETSKAILLYLGSDYISDRDILVWIPKSVISRYEDPAFGTSAKVKGWFYFKHLQGKV